MKKYLYFVVMSVAILASPFCCSGVDAKPQPYYPNIAKRVADMLAKYHVLQQPFSDDISRKAWTNLITSYDFNHSVFLQSDLDGFAYMQTRIDDALRNGDVSFGYEVNRVFCKRYAERVDFVTNLLAKGEFDYTVKEEYLWQRKDAPWPKDIAEQNELWRQRVKNELLSQILSRELDAEDEERKAEKNKADSKGEKNGKSEADDPKDEDEEYSDPTLTPEENLRKRYRQYLNVMLEPDEETVLQRYLSSVAQAYDPHSDYMSPMRKEDFDMDMNLSLCGVGAVLSLDDGALKINEVMPGGPMARDGRIKKGDRIVGVGQGDGVIEDILWQPMRKSIRKIRGPKDTKVVLEIIPRNDPSGATRKRIALIRDEIKLDEQAATGRVETVTLNGVSKLFGYVKLPSFYGTMDKKPDDPEYRSCSLDVAKYVSQFAADGAEGLILDLRGNGGGSLREAVLLDQLFVSHSPVVQIRDASGIGALNTFQGIPCFGWRKPVVVMIDRASASASEIVAGALQDTGRAIIVGDTQTHGKGTVQRVLPMGRTEYGSMKITTARFYRINGSSTQVRGVSSDIVLPSYLDVLDIGEDKLPNALPWTRIEPLPYANAWNMKTLVDRLKAASCARLAKDEKWENHLKAVALFKNSADRLYVPLDKEGRKAVMRDDRIMRDLEDGETDNEDEDEKSLARRSKRNRIKKDDPVLAEAFNILFDIVNLENGKEAPLPKEPEVPAWMKLLQ